MIETDLRIKRVETMKISLIRDFAPHRELENLPNPHADPGSTSQPNSQHHSSALPPVACGLRRRLIPLRYQTTQASYLNTIPILRTILQIYILSHYQRPLFLYLQLISLLLSPSPTHRHPRLTNPSVIAMSSSIPALKRTFLASQVRILNAPLEPPADWREGRGLVLEGALEEEVVEEVMRKGEHTIPSLLYISLERGKGGLWV